MKKIFYILALVLAIMSCEKDNPTNPPEVTPPFTTDTVEVLMENIYMPLRGFYGKEIGYDLSEAGTDLFTWALDCRAVSFCDYSEYTGEEERRLFALWLILYRGISDCNSIINRIDETELPDDIKKQDKAEASFLRAYYYWLIFETWGEVGFTSSDNSVELNSLEINTKIEVYDQIIKDLLYAESNITETSEWGKTNKPVVQAFLSRIYLFNENYANSLSYAQKVITGGGYALQSEYSDIWDIHNQTNSEFVFAINNSFDPDPYINYILSNFDERLESSTGYSCYREGGHQGHMMWEIRYESLSWGIQRDMENGRGFQRWMPTKHFIDLFDENIDQRFYGTFKNVWYSNQEDSNNPKWKPYIYIDGVQTDIPQEKWNQPMFNTGDTAILFSKTPVASNKKAKFNTNDYYYFNPGSGYLILDIDDMYNADGTPNDLTYRHFYFPPTKKVFDDTRATLTQAYSSRDASVIRYAEVLLNAVEAAMQNGDIGSAYNYLLTLADARAIDGNGAALLNAYGINSGGDIDIDFILEERARELSIEQLRWFDLNRTGKLIERVSQHNTDATTNIQGYHKLRPIPQEAIDGSFYIPEGLTQNPGY